MRGKSAFQIDLQKYYFVLFKTETPSLSQKVRLLIVNMGVHCVAVYRFGQAAERIRKRHEVIGRVMRIVYLLMRHTLVFMHKVELSQRTEIGPGFRICHVGNIYVSAYKIGENCTVTHNVTIGLGMAGPEDTVPTIGNNVWIGTGSVIAGDITIGDGATISAGSIVTRDIPAGCLVAGNPARVINREYDNSEMIVYSMKDKSVLENDSQESATTGRSEESMTVAVGGVVDNRDTQGHH